MLLVEVSSAIKAVLSLFSGWSRSFTKTGAYRYLRPLQMELRNCTGDLWLVGREMKMMCSAQSQCSQGERIHITNIMGYQWYNFPSFPVPTVGCNQCTPSSTLATALAASHPPELEVQDAEALESHWSFPGAECCGELQMGECAVCIGPDSRYFTLWLFQLWISLLNDMLVASCSTQQSKTHTNFFMKQRPACLLELPCPMYI